MQDATATEMILVTNFLFMILFLLVCYLNFTESVEVTFWTLNGRMDAIDPLTEEFNAAHDNIKVTVAYYDTDGIKDACKVAAK